MVTSQINLIGSYCYEAGNYTQNSTYQRNLNIVLSDLSVKASTTGLYNSTRGHSPNIVYGQFYCRGDVSHQPCQECVQSAAQEIVTKCSNHKEASISYEGCTLSYANRSIFSLLKTDPFNWHQNSNENISNPTQLDQVMSTTINNLIKRAAYNETYHGYETGKAPLPPDQTLYCVVQCSPGILGSPCESCLSGSYREWQTCCRGKVWAVIFQPNCQIRRKKQHRLAGVIKYSFSVINSATDNFSNDNKLGQGGSGVVYKGKLPGGREVAVKRLSKASCQALRDFDNEVQLIAKIQHENLVKLLGYKVIQIVVRAVTHDHEYSIDPKKVKLLDWETRFKIITGIARGLLHLHQDSDYKIIHRDLKPDNILLDEEMNPKIADFGVARHLRIGQTKAKTKKLRGTRGYMAPESANGGELSIKSDVYSFGVTLLEIISGLRNTFVIRVLKKNGLTDHARSLWNSGDAIELVDPSLESNFSSTTVISCIRAALLCVQDNPSSRPTMNGVLDLILHDNSASNIE
uniref:Uncharacterized protein n=1 Tax=Chenopodium quinoa TaxID=63459 RepID=A0A803N952_CHEQI